MNHYPGGILRIVASLLLPALSLTGADSIQLRPDQDTTLFELQPNANLGKSSLAVGTVALAPDRARGLIRFNLQSAIPPNARILAAELQFNVVRRPNINPAASGLELHRMLKPWNEGTKGDEVPTGEPADVGETTWNSQFHGLQTWAAPGGLAGTDFHTNITAVTTVDAVGGYRFTGAGLVADLNDWLSGGSTNHGWMIISNGEATNGTARRLGNRERLPSTEAPLLLVAYTVPAITNLVLTNQSLSGSFLAESNLNYRVAARTLLNSGAWETLTNFTPLPVTTNRSFSVIVSNTAQFFQLSIP